MRISRHGWIVLALLLALPGHAFEPPESLKSMEVGKQLDELNEELNEVAELAKIQDKVLAEFPAPSDEDTINKYREGTSRAVIHAIEQKRIGQELPEPVDPQALTEMKEDDKAKLNALAPLVVGSKTTAPAAPEGFPERVRESIADFLPVLGLSMDAVSTSDDRKAVSLKLPSWKFQYGAVSLSAAAAEPEVFKTLLDKVVEPVREEQQKALQAKIQDLDDVTYALSFGYSRSGASWDKARHLYGRDFDSYRKLVDDLYNRIWSRVTSQTLALSRQQTPTGQKFLKQLEQKRDKSRSPAAIDTSFGEVRSLIAAGELDFTEEELLGAFKDEARLLGDVEVGLGSKDFDALPSLIDNQPQLVFTLARREPSKLVGTAGTTLTARYEMGSRNFNTVLREYRDRKDGGEDGDQALLNAFTDVVKDPAILSEEKLIFSATYKWVDDYSFSHPYTQVLELDPTTGEPATEIDQTATLTLADSEEYTANLSYTRFLQRGKDLDNQTGVLLPRMTFTVEKIWVQDNPGRQNRTVAKLSYVQPTVKGLSIPVTVTWADHAEFLGEQDNTFGAHLGVSFKMGQ